MGDDKPSEAQKGAGSQADQDENVPERKDEQGAANEGSEPIPEPAPGTPEAGGEGDPDAASGDGEKD